MTVRDPNAWTYDVQFPQVRDRIIFYFINLMDGSYQEREWVKDGNELSFYQNIDSPCDMFFDEMGLDNNLDNEEIPYDLIDWSLKTKKEAEALYKVAYYLEKMILGVRPNQDYLTSPYLEPMRQASAEAFRIFMENEKDNKEFCEFIAELQEKRKQEGLTDKREM